MARVHELKTWLDPFAAVRRGAKRAEFRWDDRNFAVGDELLLQEFDPVANRYTGRGLLVKVTHLAFGFGIPLGYVMLSISRPKCARCRHRLGDEGFCPDCSWSGLPQTSEVEDRQW